MAVRRSRTAVGGLIIGLGLAGPAMAGNDEGLAAYDRGDYALAYSELAPSAAGGDAVAQYTVARMYFAGAGVSRDIGEGFKWLRKAASAGVGSAQYQLGAHSEWGIDVPQDYREAALWYRLAADRGIAEAQFRLGLLYIAGNGVAADLVTAHMWLNLAAARLPPGEARNAVTKLRESIGGKLSATQISEAQTAARNWVPVTEH